MEHHPTYQPSAFPAWAQCPSWDRKPVPEDDEAVNAGVLQHKLLADSFTCTAPKHENEYTPGAMALDLYDEDDTKDIDAGTLFAVRRAHDNIVAKLKEYYPDEEYFIFPEERCADTTLKFGMFSEEIPLFGTADLIVVPRHGNVLTVVDYKSHYTNKSYWQQLKFYAAAFDDDDGFAFANLLVVYGDNGTVDEMRDVLIKDAKEEVFRLLGDRQEKVDRPRKPGSWCDLCSHCGACAKAQAVVKRADAMLDDSAEGSVIKPEDFPTFLAVCSAVEKRIKAFREHVLQYAKENGGVLLDGDGNIAYEVQTSQRTELDINAFWKATKDILSPNAVIAAAKLPKTKAKELLKATKTMTTKEIEAVLKMSSTEPTTIEKLVRCTKGN